MRRTASHVAALAALLAALGAPQAQGAKVAAFDFCANPGGAGAQGGECREPRGVAVNESGAGGVPEGTVYVADRGNRRIQSFIPDGSFIRAWGKDVLVGGTEGFEVCEAAGECKRGQNGSGAGELASSINGVAVNQTTGDVYLVDQGNFRIQQFTAAGAFVRIWGKDVDSTGGEGFEVCEEAASCKTGAAGEGAGMFGFGASGAVAGIGVDAAGDVSVADAGNARVQKFDSEGAFLRMGGWDVDSANPSTEYEICAVATECKGGTAGKGEGQFSGSKPDFLAVGADGEVYVVDASFDNEKVVRLDSDLGLVKDPFAAGVVEGGATPLAIAVDWNDGNVYLAKRSDDRIFAIDPASEEGAANPIPAGDPFWYGLAVDSASGWMFAACGQTSSCKHAIRAFEPVERLEARTRPAQEVGPEAATLHGQVKPEGEPLSECGFEYDTAPYNEEEAPHGELVPCAEYEDEGAWQELSSPAELGTGTEFVSVRAKAQALHPGTAYRFRIVAENERPEEEGEGGPERVAGLQESFQTLGPVISASFSRGVGEAEATLVAEIDPEGNPTTYRFEYGTQGPCSTNPCQSVPVPDGAVGSDSDTHRVTEALEGLTPGTTYHWRVVATDSDEAVNEDPDRELTTYVSPASRSCPNESLRTGTPSAALPDCRAYEMVSPVDKNGGDVIVGGDLSSAALEAAYRRASVDGRRLTYSSSTAFGDSLRSARSNQYLATRGGGGWSSHALLPAQGPTVFDPSFSSQYDYATNFQAFTPDLCHALMRDHNRTPLAPGAIVGFTNLYLRDNCGPGADGYEALTVGALPAFFPEAKDLTLEGARIDATGLGHIFFNALGALEATPAPAMSTRRQVYDAVVEPTGRKLRLVSALPGGEGDPQRSGLGSRSIVLSRGSNLTHALSSDGSRAFWSSDSGSGTGFIYLRANPGANQSDLADGGASGEGVVSAGSNEVTGVVTETGDFAAGQKIYGAGIPRGTTIEAVGAGTLTLSAEATRSAGATALVSASECTEPAKACTVPVSSGGGDTTFWSADPSGSKAIYGEDGGLYELDVDAALAGEDASAVTGIASRAEGVAGASGDLSRVYFTSTEAIPGAVPNERGEGPREEKPNLYLSEEGKARFISTAADAVQLDSSSSLLRASRAGPDGRVLAFMSRSAELAESVAGYDTADIATGEPAAQIYRYDADANGGDGELRCLSCNPSGARPEAQPPYTPYSFANKAAFPAAAWLPTCEWSNYCKRTLSADGNRLFFNAYDSLVPEDRNDAQDVYQWEAPGTGTCTTSDPRYFPANGGCLHLLSTGKSKADSEFLDASASGSDAFLTTASDIDPRDLAFIDVYDARVGGGLPPPEPEKTPCVGDACQSVPAAPEAPAPASEAYAGPGNPPAARSACAAPARRARALARKAKRLRRAAKRSSSPRRSGALRRRARARARGAKRLSRNAKRCRRGRRAR